MFFDLEAHGEPLGTPWASHGAAVASHGRPMGVAWDARVAPMGRQWGAMGSQGCSMRPHWRLMGPPWAPGGISSPSWAMLRSSLDIRGAFLRPSCASYGPDGVLQGSSLGLSWKGKGVLPHPSKVMSVFLDGGRPPYPQSRLVTECALSLSVVLILES